jgi:hypothetical protein
LERYSRITTGWYGYRSTHYEPHINESLSSADLDYEIGQSKQCLENHGINPTMLAYPYGEGSNNSAVINTVAKSYNLARTDSKYALSYIVIVAALVSIVLIFTRISKEIVDLILAMEH